MLVLLPGQQVVGVGVDEAVSHVGGEVCILYSVCKILSGLSRQAEPGLEVPVLGIRAAGSPGLPGARPIPGAERC
jgi:hypothetical protein